MRYIVYTTKTLFPLKFITKLNDTICKLLHFLMHFAVQNDECLAFSWRL